MATVQCVLQECLTSVSHQSVLPESPKRVFSENVELERPRRLSLDMHCLKSIYEDVKEKRKRPQSEREREKDREVWLCTLGDGQHSWVQIRGLSPTPPGLDNPSCAAGSSAELQLPEFHGYQKHIPGRNSDEYKMF